MDRARVFIGYAPQDIAFLEQLQTHLSPLERLEMIEIFHQGRVTPGLDLRHDVEHYLSIADFIILLLSADFIASDFCYLVELEQAMMRQRGGRAHVLPVIVRDCAWQVLSIGALKALPERASSLMNHPNPEEVYVAVSDTLRRFLTQFASPPRGGPRATYALVPPGGGYDASRYVKQSKHERDVINHLNTPGTPAVLRAPSSYGKTWLIQRVSEALRKQQGTYLCSLNLRMLGPFNSSEVLFSTLSEELLNTFRLPVARPRRATSKSLSPSLRFSRLLENILKEHIAEQARLVLVIDHADAVANPAQPQNMIGNDLFGLLRGITERACTEVSSPYRRLRMLVAISYSPAFLLNGVNQSLFNFVDDIALSSFDRQQLAELAAKYSVAISPSELDALYAFIGGHPYLSSRAFYLAGLENRSMRSLIADWEHGNFAMFDEHLRRIRSNLQRLGVLAAVRRFLQRDRIHGIAPSALEVLQRVGVIKFNHNAKSGYELHSSIYRALV